MEFQPSSQNCPSQQSRRLYPVLSSQQRRKRWMETSSLPTLVLLSPPTHHPRAGWKRALQGRASVTEQAQTSTWSHLTLSLLGFSLDTIDTIGQIPCRSSGTSLRRAHFHPWQDLKVATGLIIIKKKKGGGGGGEGGIKTLEAFFMITNLTDKLCFIDSSNSKFAFRTHCCWCLK